MNFHSTKTLLTFSPRGPKMERAELILFQTRIAYSHRRKRLSREAIFECLTIQQNACIFVGTPF
ncbi:hypothetical protein LINPERPRIM_LOCUS23651, partial [Linum perenne]